VILNCGDSPDDKKDKAPLKDYKDSEVRMTAVKKILGKDTKATMLGQFNNDKQEEVAAGVEINTKDSWGIKFAFLDISGDEPKKTYETKLLDGSFENSRFDKIKLPSFDYELLYYNSDDFFMGSGGGEIFSYIVDYYKKDVYYSHLVADSKRISLYISDNIKDEEIRNFFFSSFKKDFPSYELVLKDVEFDD